MSDSVPRYRNLFLLIAAVGVVFGVLGLMDLQNVPYGGFFLGRNNDVVRVFDGGPGAAAGMQLGDVVQSIDGISIDDTKALTRRPRPAIGETREFVVTREGETMELAVTYERQPSRNRFTTILGFVVGLCFLGFCLWAYLKVSSEATLKLALFGLCFGIAFLPGPYSSSVQLRTLGGAVSTFLVVVGFAFLIHFLLLFPKRRPFADRPAAGKIIYGPALLVALFLVFQIVLQPEATSALRQITGVVVGLFVVGYFGWSLVTMLGSFLRASAGERSAHGVSLMLAGTLAGLLPVTISQLVLTVSPSTLLPGAQYYGLALGLIPIAFARAAVRKASAPAA